MFTSFLYSTEEKHQKVYIIAKTFFTILVLPDTDTFFLFYILIKQSPSGF